MTREPQDTPPSGPHDRARSVRAAAARLPGLRRRLVLARLTLAWERIGPALWPAAGLLALFLAAALMDLLPALGFWGHSLALLAFAAGFGALARRGWRRIRWPDAEAARRRLEQASGLDHRPLSGLDDQLASGAEDPAARALWQAHLERLRATIRRLRVGPPRGTLAGADPRGLRAVPMLLLVVGLAAAGANWPERLARAAVPSWPGAPVAAAQVDVWIDPPGYTGQAPRYLATDPEKAQDRIAVPDGSRLLAQVSGGAGTPKLAVGGDAQPLERAAEGAWKAEVALAPGDGPRLAVTQGGSELAGWQLAVTPDRAPTAAFRDAPGSSERKALRIAYRASDDYGVDSIELRLAHPKADGAPAPDDARAAADAGTADSDSDGPPAIVLDLPAGGAGDGKIENTSYHDLTAHPWAGTQVQATLIATDARGQTGRSDTVTVTLPQRSFTHPVAQALVELRRQLTLKPDERYPVIRELNALGNTPRAFNGDVVVQLALRTAERRLVHDKRDQAVGQVQELMWQTALRLEEGDLAIAERDLRRAQRALEEALADDSTTQAELNRLMDELQQAMDRFMQAMREQMQRQLQQGMEPQQLPPDAQVLRSQDLQQMLDKMRELTESGARDAARQMLSQLQNMLENLRNARPMTGQQSEQARRAMEMMRSMQELSERQRELLDESFRMQQQRQGRQGQQGRQGLEGMPRSPGGQGQMGQGRPRAGGGQQAPADRQEALRRQLGQMMRDLADQMGRIPQPLGRAEQRMRDATGALREGQPGQAVGPQQDALDQLQQGMNAMRQQMQRQLGQQPGQGQGPAQGRSGWRPGMERDPLGRSRENRGRAASGEDVRIPDEMELQRSREILNELRERSGERSRPEFELDYLERLLNRF